jgi:hypothetical protein
MEEWLVYAVIAAVVVLASSWFLRPTKGTQLPHLRRSKAKIAIVIFSLIVN